MEISISSSKINQELHTICTAFGMNISHIFLLLSLFISVFLFAPYQYGLQGIYILCAILFFPLLLKSFVKKHAEKPQYQPLLFLSIAEKYHYFASRFIMQLYCFRISCIFLLLWQFSCHLNPSENKFFQIYPSLVLILQLMIRLLLSLVLRIKIHFDLLQNKI